MRVERALDDLASSPHLSAIVRQQTITHRRRFLNAIRAIVTHLDHEGDAIADIGCGSGVSLALAHAAGFRRFIAADLNWDQPTVVTHLPAIQAIVANFNHDGFLTAVPDQSVDCVLSSQVLEHILHHPMGYLEECWRILAPGGVMVVDVPNPATLANGIRLLRGRAYSWGDWAFATRPKLNLTETFAPWDIHFREYFPTEFRAMLTQLPASQLIEAGFVASEAEPRRGLKPLVKKVLAKAPFSNARLLSDVQYAVLRRAN